MPRKTEFTIPTGDVTAEGPRKTRQSLQDIQRTEQLIPLPSSKQKRSGQPSRPRHQEDVSEAQGSGGPSQDTEEVHTLQLDALEDDPQAEEGHSPSNACIQHVLPLEFKSHNM